ncbi:MAG: gamma-glutamylcyclotransferase [Cyanobacteria bacterium J06638_22]
MSETRRVFICGSALRGQPDHQNLGNAKFIKETKTQPLYRLHSVQNGWHPGIYSVETGGISIPGEIYEMSLEEFNYLAENEPPNMYPETILLEGNETAIAFLYPRELIEEHEWEDISQYGGWVAYKEGLQGT